jgi:hypothetical protein
MPDFAPQQARLFATAARQSANLLFQCSQIFIYGAKSA